MRNTKRPRHRPLVVQIGDARTRIYRDSYYKIVRGRRRRYQRFTVAHYRLDGEKRKRFRQSFASLEDARFEATRIATAVANGEGDVLKLKSGDRATYLHAINALRPLKMPLHVAIDEYVEARRHAAGASLVAAAREYAQRHAGEPVRKAIGELVKEFIAAKEQDGMSVRYLRSLRSHLNRFSQHFQMNIGTITVAQIEDWLRRTKRGPRTRNNIRLSLITLFNFAKARGYLSKAIPTEAEHIAKANDRGGKIGILRPEQLSGLLAEAGSEETKLFLTLAAFTGLRRCELLRLHWEDVKFERGKIEVGKDKAKTATRRLVPIQPNLLQWIAAHRARTGRVFLGGEDAANRAIGYAKAAGLEWPNNALRHSYATYRLAQCQDPARVALEMGNSPQMLFRNYRELADEQDATLWFSIVPPAAARNVVQMRRRR
jgi:integrase